MLHELMGEAGVAVGAAQLTPPVRVDGPAEGEIVIGILVEDRFGEEGTVGGAPRLPER
jgi:hypothetical protein